MNDDLVARELSAAFAVDHSPEFLARVRTRIASDPAPRMWTVPWLAFAGAAVTAVAAIALAASVTMRQGPAPPLPAARAAHDIAFSAPPASLNRDGERVRSAPPRRLAAPIRKDDSEALVLVSAEEQQALQALLRVAYQGGLPVLPEDAAAARGDTAQSAHIAITPIVVERLQVARLEEDAEGAQQ